MTTSRRPAPLMTRRGLARAVSCAATATVALAALAQPAPPSPPTAPSLPTALPAPLAAALRASGVPPEAVSLWVAPAEGGGPRLSHEAHTVRQSASVMKLFTTGVALQTLGPAYTWRTDAGLGGALDARGVLHGPLHLRGSGDPELVLEKAWLMLARWRAAGLQTIEGDLVLDRRAFALPPHDPAAFDGRALKPYNAGPDALLLNHQAVALRLRPDALRPGWARASMEPALDGVTLDAQVRLSPGVCGDWREALALQMRPETEPSAPPGSAPPNATAGLPNWTVSLRGSYPQACGERDWPVLWQGSGPGDFTARLLSTLWRESGGQLRGRVRAGDWPDELPVWQSWPSAPLGLVVRDINKFSNNVMARQLFLTLGSGPATTSWANAAPSASPGSSPASAPATLAQARSLVTQQVLAATREPSGASPCANGTLVMDNGSGLSRSERSSAACLGRWLQALWASPVMPELLASLPITGQDGTTRRWQSVAGGKAHIKTGSLDGVVAMAGVVEGDSGRRHAVVAVVNHPQADAARPLMEALVAWAQHDQ